MSAWTVAFSAAYAGTPDWSPLAALMSTRSGKSVSEEWLQANIDEAFAHVMNHAPCQVWANPGELPPVSAAVLSAVLSRSASNPEGVRTIQMGEFSQTWAGSINGPGGLLTDEEARMVSRDAGCQGGFSSVELVPTPILGRALPEQRAGT